MCIMVSTMEIVLAAAATLLLAMQLLIYRVLVTISIHLHHIRGHKISADQTAKRG